MECLEEPSIKPSPLSHKGDTTANSAHGLALLAQTAATGTLVNWEKSMSH